MNIPHFSGTFTINLSQLEQKVKDESRGYSGSLAVKQSAMAEADLIEAAKQPYQAAIEALPEDVVVEYGYEGHRGYKRDKIEIKRPAQDGWLSSILEIYRDMGYQPKPIPEGKRLRKKERQRLEAEQAKARPEESRDAFFVRALEEAQVAVAFDNRQRQYQAITSRKSESESE